MDIYFQITDYSKNKFAEAGRKMTVFKKVVERGIKRVGAVSGPGAGPPGGQGHHASERH